MTDPTARDAETVTDETGNTTSSCRSVVEAKREAAEFKDKLLRALAEMERADAGVKCSAQSMALPGLRATYWRSPILCIVRWKRWARCGKRPTPR